MFCQTDWSGLRTCAGTVKLACGIFKLQWKVRNLCARSCKSKCLAGMEELKMHFSGPSVAHLYPQILGRLGRMASLRPAPGPGRPLLKTNKTPSVFLWPPLASSFSLSGVPSFTILSVQLRVITASFGILRRGLSSSCRPHAPVQCNCEPEKGDLPYRGVRVSRKANTCWVCGWLLRFGARNSHVDDTQDLRD